MRSLRTGTILPVVADAVPAAAGLVTKGWSVARQLALEADTARLRAMSPGEGICEFLALAELAQRLAPAGCGADDHLAALIAVARLFHRTGML